MSAHTASYATACAAPCVAIPLHRPLWQRLAERLAEQWQHWSAVPWSARVDVLDLRDAMSLNDHTLRDIGVSDTLRDKASAWRDLESLGARASRHDSGQHGHQWYG